MTSVFYPTRDPSGTNITETQEDIYLLRTILYTYSNEETKATYEENGYLKTGLQQGIRDEIEQIYTGFRFISWLKKKVDVLGTPATLICPDTNVIIAGMIYLRDTNSQHKTAINESEDIETYFKKLEEAYRVSRKRAAPVWLGCPSMVYSYKNRNKLQDKLLRYNFPTCISFLFAPTSAATTNWIQLADKGVFNKSNTESRKSVEDAEQAVEDAEQALEEASEMMGFEPADAVEAADAALLLAKTEAETTFANLTPNEIAGCQSLYGKDFIYMSKAEKIELFKLSIDNLKFKSHTGAAKGGYWQHRTLSKKPKLLRSFQKSFEFIKTEQMALNETVQFLCNEKLTAGNYPVQRYNETWSSFYPWDICGAEIGAFPLENSQNIIALLRQENEKIMRLLSNDQEHIAQLVVKFFSLSDRSFYNQAQMENDEKEKLALLLCKYLKECYPLNNYPKDLNSTENLLEFIKFFIQSIIEIMEICNDELSLYVYTNYKDDTIQNYYSLYRFNPESMTRPKFIYYRQDKSDASQITFVTKANKQLNFSKSSGAAPPAGEPSGPSLTASTEQATQRPRAARHMAQQLNPNPRGGKSLKKRKKGKNKQGTIKKRK